jgi:threonine dehydrogenase-like Zn-dependent dehydrogenase
MLAMIAEGRLRPGRLVTEWIGLDHVPGALVRMSEPTPGVTVIRPNG